MIREPVWFIDEEPTFQQHDEIPELLDYYATNLTKYYPSTETNGDGRWTLVVTTALHRYFAIVNEARFNQLNIKKLENELKYFPTVELSKQLAKDNCTLGASLDLRMVNGSDWLLGKNKEAIVDFSKKGACQAYQRMLEDLFASTKLAVGYIDSNYYLYYYNSYINEEVMADPVMRARPNQYWTAMLECVAQLVDSKKGLISEVAFKSQHLPIWSLSYNNLATVLSLSMAGYSWLIAPVYTYWDLDGKEERFVRALQAHALMPVLSFKAEGNLDGNIGRELLFNTTAATRALISKAIALHNEHVDLFVELAKRRVRDGSPIIRPMWYEAPDDPKTYAIKDQYMLGENIVVAPVMEEGKRERQVYLPLGTWIDQYGRSFEGPGEFLVAAPLEELPYFKRQI